MNEKELQELLRQAQEAMQAGVSYNDVNTYIREHTEGKYAGLMSLQIAVDPATRANEQRAEQVRTFQEHSPVAQRARMVMQGATFGFGDELAGVGAALVPGGKGFSEGVDASRARVAANRAVDPIGSSAAEIAGTFLTAGPAGGQAFNTLRGAGGLARTAGAASAVGAVEGGLYATGEAEGSPAERAPSAAVGTVAGGVTGLLAQGGIEGAMALERGAGGLLRPAKTAARKTLTRTAERAGIAAEDLPSVVQNLGDDAVLADIPAFGAQVPGALRTSVTRPMQAIETLRARIDPNRVASARRALWKPLEEANFHVADPDMLRFLRSNSTTNEVLGEVLGSPRGVTGLNFREIQSIRDALGKRISRGNAVEIGDAIAARDRFDSFLDHLVPNFRPTRSADRELMQRVAGQERLQRAIDQAYASFDAGLPTASSGAVRSEVFNLPARRQKVAEIISEMLLEPNGAERVRDRIQSGELFREFGKSVGRATRQVGQTEIGRAFASVVQPSGLLRPDEPAEPVDVTSPDSLTRTGLLGASY